MNNKKWYAPTFIAIAAVFLVADIVAYGGWKGVFEFYKTGYNMGLGLFLFKYGDYFLHREEYYSEEQTAELYEHDHLWYMIARNFLFYACLSWFGVYCFITMDE